MPIFSVVVINYNGKQFLKRCLEKVAISDLKPAKVIVVDDASIDNTDEMVRSEFPGVLFLRHTENRGPTAARNTGAREARGKYIIFLDNDVLVKESTFGELVRFMESHSNAGMCGPKLDPEGGGKIKWNMGHDQNLFRALIGSMFEQIGRIFPSSPMIKRASMPFTLNVWDHDHLLPVDWVMEPCMIVP